MPLQQPPVASTKANNSFLYSVVDRILGTSNVATSTADRLRRNGIDADRLAQIVSYGLSDETERTFELKLIAADPDTPDNFGVLVRRHHDSRAQ
jgi:hypothetical protein